ncbi:MAG: hypothetical protein ACK4WK_02250 [Anaerolineae bacterium]
MPGVFTVRDFRDMVAILERYPEWRQEFRRLLLTDDVLALPRVVAELAEAQKRTEAVVAELAEAQRRAEERLSRAEERLAGVEERLAGVEERLSRLEAVVAELAEAQKRTEVAVAELAAAQKRISESQARIEDRLAQLSRLESIIGVTVEEEAADVLRVVMERKGYRVRGEPIWWRPDGDVDVILPVEDPEGVYIHVVLEAKARLGWRAVEAWANRMRSKGFRVRLAEGGFAGPYLVYVYGMRADTSAEEAARNFGIGLLTPRGEVVPPRGLE